MEVSAILKRFMEKSPIPVMARALLEKVLTTERLNTCFNAVAEKQYTRDLLFSSLFELMSLVVMKVFPSVNSAYQAEKANVGVSIASVYNKLNSLEETIPAQLMRDTSQDLAGFIEEMDGACAPLIQNYRVLMLDGNCLAGTQHRLAVLRGKGAGALPGKSLVIYDPSLEMAIDVILCQDGHAQERSLLGQVLDRIKANDVYVMDRNFCVRSHLFGTEDRGAFFVVRHHKQMPYQAVGQMEEIGTTETGSVYQQSIEVTGEDGRASTWRAITVRLKNKTRDGDTELVIITNLPPAAADAIAIAKIYRNRWTIETMFQELEAHLTSEINTLGYPQAALFGFCVALIAYNVLAVIKAALRQAHGEEKIRNEVSGYYIAGEISRTHEGMEIAIEAEEWGAFQTLTQKMFVAVLLQLAKNVQLDLYKKHKRGPKKAQPPRTSDKNAPHVSTAKLLLKAKNSP
jgi:IS4 transposase